MHCPRFWHMLGHSGPHGCRLEILQRFWHDATTKSGQRNTFTQIMLDGQTALYQWEFRKMSRCVRNRQNSTWCAYLALTTERKQEKLCRLPYLFVRLHICHACLAHWDRHVHRKCWRDPLLQTKTFNTPHVCNLMPFVRVIVHPGLWLSTENADLFYMFHRPRFFHKTMEQMFLNNR